MDIKSLREQTRMTQREFSEYFDIPVRTIENWEGGKRTPPVYVAELIKYKIEKERLGMLDFGELMLKDTDESQVYYVATLDTHIFVETDRRKLWGYSPVGKIRIYHDGTYMGTPEQMEDWIREQIVDHLVAEGHLAEDGETVLGEKCWKLQA